ncbi:MmgE/PrpD family protein [Salipiger pacificus]|nr:MmgE/PrpD family protein [Alloyangia pacifica]
MKLSDSPSVTLANWAATADASAPELIEGASAAFADTLACMLGGRNDNATQAVLQAARATHGAGEAAVWGTGQSLSPAGAALVEGTAAHALDFDDNFAPAVSHASAVLVPALLAMAAGRAAISGHALLRAYCIGLEVQARIGAVMQPEHYGAGWHSTSTVGAIGAAAACARLIGADGDAMARAMSLAYSQSSGSKLQFGSEAKPTHAGLAARAAVTAAALAEAGLGAKSEFVAGPWGMADLFAGTKRAMVLDDLGTSWALLTDGLMVKRFPCCAASHRALDGVEFLLTKHGFGLADVERVEVEMPDLLARNLRYDAPETAAEARFSLSYPVLRLLSGEGLSLFHFTQEAVSAIEDRTALARIIRKPVDPGPKGMHRPYGIKVMLRDGGALFHEQASLVGTIGQPLSQAQMNTKIADCLAWAGLTGWEGRFDAALGALPQSSDVLACLAALAEEGQA